MKLSIFEAKHTLSSLADKVNGSQMTVGKIVGLTSLEGWPEKLTTLRAVGNNIKNLKGCPEKVAFLDLGHNELTSLEGAPKEIAALDIDNNPQLKSLAGLSDTVISGYLSGYLRAVSCGLTTLKGGPRSVEMLNVSGNMITSLDGCQDIEIDPSGLDVSYNKLVSLHNVHKHLTKFKGPLWLTGNKIVSHTLGLLKVVGLTSVKFDISGRSVEELGRRAMFEIINKHLDGERDVFACQEELIDAGFEEFAQL